VLGTITKAYSLIGTTSASYTWTFDGAATIDLLPGQTYYITTEMAAGSTTSEYYYFAGTYTDNSLGDLSWGGKSVDTTVQSNTSQAWTTWPAASYTGRDMYDLWFKLQGEVLPQGGGALMMSLATGNGGSNPPGETAAPLSEEPVQINKKLKSKARSRLAAALASSNPGPAAWRLEDLDAAPSAARNRNTEPEHRSKSLGRAFELRLAKWSLVSLDDDWKKLP
jgi:hypothetical protein